MVARTNANLRIEIGFKAIEAALSDLPELVDEWDELPDGERASWSLDWDHLMGSYLTLMDEQHRANAMTSAQSGRYEALRTRLRAAMPAIKQLNLYRPPIALD